MTTTFKRLAAGYHGFCEMDECHELAKLIHRETKKKVCARCAVTILDLQLATMRAPLQSVRIERGGKFRMRGNRGKLEL